MGIDALQAKIRTLKSPILLGYGPALADLPPQFLTGIDLEAPQPEAAAQALGGFGYALFQALTEVIPAVKLHAAMFECYGAPGLAALQTLAKQAKELGYFVILDIARSENTPTTQLLARCYFGGWPEAPFDCDAVTVNGYLGTDAITPWVQLAREKDRGIFLLARTSNRSSRQFQDLLSGDRVVHTAMLDLGLRAAADDYEDITWSRVAAVVTPGWGVELAKLRVKYPRTFFLLPEYGGQGATAETLSAAFDECGHGAIIQSKAIVTAWKAREDGAERYQELALEAARKMKKELNRAFYLC